MMKRFLIACTGLLLCYSLSSQNIDDTLVTRNDLSQQNKSILTHVIDWYAHNLNYGSITLLMTVESSFIPFPSEVVVPPAAYTACLEESSLHISPHNWLNVFIVVLFATLGALIGALINYYLAVFLGRPAIYWFADSKLGHLFMLNGTKIKKAEDYFIAHGVSSTLIGRLIPVIRQLISIPAGLAKMKIVPFIAYTALGAFIWNVILALLGYAAHGQKDLIDRYSHEISWGLVGLGVLFVGYLVVKSVRKRKKERKKKEMKIDK
jgi:membrane protein DedA with SNARE-associated domain